MFSMFGSKFLNSGEQVVVSCQALIVILYKVPNKPGLTKTLV